MDSKAWQDFFFIGLYPLWVLITLIIAVFATAYFLPERKRTSKKSFEQRVRK
jgi:hypothetical protein